MKRLLAGISMLATIILLALAAPAVASAATCTPVGLVPSAGSNSVTFSGTATTPCDSLGFNVHLTLQFLASNGWVGLGPPFVADWTNQVYAQRPWIATVGGGCIQGLWVRSRIEMYNAGRIFDNIDWSPKTYINNC